MTVFHWFFSTGWLPVLCRVTFPSLPVGMVTSRSVGVRKGRALVFRTNAAVFGINKGGFCMSYAEFASMEKPKDSIAKLYLVLSPFMLLITHVPFQ